MLHKQNLFIFRTIRRLGRFYKEKLYFFRRVWSPNKQVLDVPIPTSLTKNTTSELKHKKG